MRALRRVVSRRDIEVPSDAHRKARLLARSLRRRLDHPGYGALLVGVVLHHLFRNAEPCLPDLGGDEGQRDRNRIHAAVLRL